jgi:hypothetical protein
MHWYEGDLRGTLGRFESIHAVRTVMFQQQHTDPQNVR